MRWRWLVPLLGALALGAAFALRRDPERARGAAPRAEARQERAVSSAAPAPELVAPRAASAEPGETPRVDAPGRREAVAEAGALVAGRVEVEGGLPAGEKVVVVAHAYREGVSRLHSRAFEAPVALDGSFELRVPEGTRSVGLELEALLLFLPEEVEVRPGTRDVVLRPNVLAAVRGRVHRPLGLDAVPSAEETIHVSAGRSAVYADPDGRFELVVRPDEPLELVARTGAAEGMEKRLELAPLRAGELRQVDVFLEPMHWLHGLVTDESGAPLTDATVELLIASERRLEDLPPEPQQTGADGRFVIGPIRPGPCEIQASAPGWRNEVLELELPADGRELLRFVLTPAVVVRGRVVGPDGAPRAGASVRKVPEPGRLILLSNRARTDLSPLPTDEEGRFTYTGDEATIRLVASADGFARSLPLVIEPGTASTDGEVVLTLRPACSLRVHVFDESGQPADVFLTLRSEDGTQHVLRGDKGVVVGHAFPPGRAWIEAGPFRIETDADACRYTGSVEVVLTPEVEARAELRLRRTN